MRAGIYYRVSTEEQVDGYSLDAQRRALVDFCGLKGWAVAGDYADEGRSARGDNIDKRPAFKRMLEDAAAGQLDVVVVHKIDRFARNIRVTFECLELLARHDVAFIAGAQPDLDYTRPEGRLFMGMMATLAQYYSDNLSQETKKGKQERKKQGLYNGHVPYGMMKGEGGVPVPNPETIEGLRLVFTLAAEGRSDREIAQTLNDRGYRTNSNRGNNPFTKDTICAIVQNRFYLGELPGEASGETLPGRHDAVIDQATFDAALVQRERRAVGGRQGVRRDATVYSLSGLAVCAHCGGRLRIQPNKGKPRLFCANRQQTGGCTYRSTFLTHYEGQISAYLAKFRIPANYRERLQLYVLEEAKKEYVDTSLQRHRLNLQLDRLKDLYQLGDIERERYLAERERVRRELAVIEAQNTEENAELDELAGLLKNLQQGWDQATQEQRNRLARLIFEEIVINDDRVVAMKPRPELAGFFAIDCQVRGLEVHRGGSDGGRVRAFTGRPRGRRPLLPHRGAAVGAADVAGPQAAPPRRGPRWGAGRARAA